jgi:hypothetical protein
VKTESHTTAAGGNGNGVVSDDEAKRWQERAQRAEREAAEAGRARHEAEAREAKLAERLRETSKALVDANQELAQGPLLKHRLAEMYDHNAGLQAKLQEVLTSRSCQTTEVLRKVSRVLKLQR